MKHPNRKSRTGFSLLELMVATAMLATLVTSVSLLLRAGQNSWDAHESDHAKLEAAHAVVRHLVRQVRQATEVTAISDPDDTTGSLSVTMPGGDAYTWSLTGSQVQFTIPAGSSVMSNEIDELTFVGYKADGETTTADADEVQAVLCSVKVTLPRETNADRTVSCMVWLRAW